jgi:hypothetical protein
MYPLPVECLKPPQSLTEPPLIFPQVCVCELVANALA